MNNTFAFDSNQLPASKRTNLLLFKYIPVLQVKLG